jgi:hypothetical protein
MHWILAHKFHPRCVALADRHYSRQSPGSPQFCRPGYNLTLFTRAGGGEAVFNWWRPRWDIGRKDNLRAIECTIFRNETQLLSSALIVEATAAVLTWRPSPHEGPDQHRDTNLITSVHAEATQGRRSRHHRPGHCFRCAGWEDLDHRAGRATCWLVCPSGALPPPQQPLGTPADQTVLPLT